MMVTVEQIDNAEEAANFQTLVGAGAEGGNGLTALSPMNTKQQ